MKKLLLISLICLLVFSFAITAMAKVHITFWQYPCIPPYGDKQPGWYEKEIIAEFEEMYPEVEIEFLLNSWNEGPAKIETLIAVGETPDILFDATVRTLSYAKRDLLLSFDDILTEEEKAEFPLYLYKGCSNDRGLVIFPWAVDVRGGHYVNLELVKKVGAYDLLPLDKPERTWTIEEFEAFLVKCKPLTEEGIYLFSIPAANEQSDETIQHYMRQWGADMFDVDSTRCTINSPEAIACLEWLLHLHTEGLMNPHPESTFANENNDRFWSGRMVMSGASTPWVTVQKYIDIGMEGSFVMLPAPEGRKPRTLGVFIGPVAFDNGDPEKAKYAKLFCKYWSSKDPMVTGMFPAKNIDVTYDDDNLNFKRNVMFKYAELCEGSTFPYYRQYRAMLFPEVQAIFTHLKTPAQALKDLEEAVNALLE